MKFSVLEMEITSHIVNYSNFSPKSGRGYFSSAFMYFQPFFDEYFSLYFLR